MNRAGPAPATRTLDFVSLGVRVRGEATPALAALLEADWQRRQPGWPVRSTLDVELLRDNSPANTNVAGALTEARTHNGPLAFRRVGETYTLADGGLTLQTGPQFSHIGLGHEVDPTALLLAFTEVQRASGLLPLHAAVLHRDGQTVAVSGPSGAGKSTAALRLLGHGWSLVAEDWAWLAPEGLHLSGWDSGLRLRPESLERFAPQWLQLPTDPHGKHLLRPPPLEGPHTLTALYFLASGPATSSAELVRAVWGMVGAPLTPAARQATQAGVNRLLGTVPLALIDRDELVAKLGG